MKSLKIELQKCEEYIEYLEGVLEKYVNENKVLKEENKRLKESKN